MTSNMLRAFSLAEVGFVTSIAWSLYHRHHEY